MPKTISITVAVVAVILFLCLWPADFDLETKGTLEPVERRNIFASVDKCTVQDIYVKHGDTVKAGQPLVKLSSPDIALMMEDTVGKLGARGEKIVVLGIGDQPAEYETLRTRKETASSANGRTRSEHRQFESATRVC